MKMFGNMMCLAPCVGSKAMDYRPALQHLGWTTRHHVEGGHHISPPASMHGCDPPPIPYTREEDEEE